MAAWGIPIELGLLGLAGWSVRSPVLGISRSPAVLVLTMLAGWLPARRATRVDPMAALRSE